MVRESFKGHKSPQERTHGIRAPKGQVRAFKG